MKKIVLFVSIFFACTALQAQVGIGTTTPNSTALLHVEGGSSTTKGLLITGTYNGGATVPDLGSGVRLMFYPGKGAFRAGYVNGTQWNNANVGNYSVAMGYSTKASGISSIAMGDNSIASGISSTAMGLLTNAGGDYSTAMGYGTNASGSYSTAMGYGTTASGNTSTAMGATTTASGFLSTAMGATTTASGDYSTAMGFRTTASGYTSTAMGDQTSASGILSTAIGDQTSASGNNSTAMGVRTTASGDYSTAMGNGTTAGGSNSTAMGQNTTASGDFSTAMGLNTTASGTASTAMGYRVSTNNQTGSFYFGDSDPNNAGILNSTAANQFSARFNGGYYFISEKTSSTTVGAQLLPGQSSWSAISDVRRKENFLPVNAEDVLKKIAGFQLTTWNYKGQSAKTFRHYGPMAQDFYAAFGKDALGTIGCDTLINQQDFLGVSFIAIQALEKRTAGLKNENEKIKIANSEIKNENILLAKKLADVDEIKKENESLKQSIAQLEKKLDEQQKLLVQSMAQINSIVQKQNKTEVMVAKN